VNAAGSITVVAGAGVVAAALLSPSHGVVARAVRRRRLGHATAIDDVLATLYRSQEAGRSAMSRDGVRDALPGVATGRTLASTARRGLTRDTAVGVELTDRGRAAAAELIRRHRLWEQYLVADAGMRPDHVHPAAEALEHLAVAPADGPTLDPHGRPIPTNRPTTDEPG
jgi:Mn-dependent DtxR family transcriptional regulator